MTARVFTQPTADILVVGAGLAGLVIAYRLQVFGVAVDVVEARDRPGGRIHSIHNALGTSLTAELGGEAFDSDNVACLNLAQSLGLPVVDLRQQAAHFTAATFWFGGSLLHQDALQAELTALLQVQAADWQAVQQFVQTGVCSDRVRQLDHQSISDYLAVHGASVQLQQAVATAYGIRYGVEAELQSCLNLLSYFRCAEECDYLFGPSDERYYLQGGNGQLSQALFERVAARVALGTALEALAATGDRRYRVTLRHGNTVWEREYSCVVLTIPFSVLRHLSLQVELPEQQRRAIATLGYNTPCKVISAYATKPWLQEGSSGLVYTDLPFQHCWEACDSLRSERESLLVAYPGGEAGRAIAQLDPTLAAEKTVHTLAQLFPALPDAQLTQAVLRSAWLDDPFSQGAYSYYQVGQWSAFLGCEGERVDNLLFAGEHCSRQFQGFMEGACETAEQVVLDILQDLALTEKVAVQRSRLRTYAQQRQTGFALHPNSLALRTVS